MALPDWICPRRCRADHVERFQIPKLHSPDNKKKMYVDYVLITLMLINKVELYTVSGLLHCLLSKIPWHLQQAIHDFSRQNMYTFVFKYIKLTHFFLFLKKILWLSKTFKASWDFFHDFKSKITWLSKTFKVSWDFFHDFKSKITWLSKFSMTRKDPAFGLFTWDDFLTPFDYLSYNDQS